MRRSLGGVVTALVLVMAAACGADPDDQSGEPGADATDAIRPATAAELTDLWLMVPDVGPRRLMLTFKADGTYEAFDRCNTADGTWKLGADGELSVDAGPVVRTTPDPERTPADCTGMLETEPLDALGSARLDGEDLVLLDDVGAEFGRFGAARPGGLLPEADDGAPLDLADEPVRLPDGLEPAERDDLLGSWLPESGEAEGRAYLTFRDDGSVGGSDGCNGVSGTWGIAPDGTLLTTTGPSTLIGCENVPVASWLGEARRAGFDGEVLVLADQEGEPNGRLVRGTPVTAAP